MVFVVWGGSFFVSSSKYFLLKQALLWSVSTVFLFPMLISVLMVFDSYITIYHQKKSGRADSS